MSRLIQEIKGEQMHVQEQAEYERDLARIQQASEYNLRHLAQHLHAAGQDDKLYQLLVKNQAWLEAKFARLGGDEAYVSDLELALANFNDPLEARQLLTLVQLHTARRAVNQRIGLYNDTDLTTLIWLGREAEALSYVRLRDDPKQRADGLLTVYNTLRERGRPNPALLDEAEPAIYTITAPSAQVESLCSLAVALALARDSRAEAIFAEVRMVADRLGNSTTNLERWASYLDLMRALIYLERYDEAKALAHELAEDPQDFLKNNELIAGVLIETLARIGRYDEIEPLIPLVKHDKVRARLLDNLEKALAESGNKQANTLLDQVRCMAQDIPEDLRQRALAPPNLATALTQSSRRLADAVGVDFSEAEREHIQAVQQAKLYDQIKGEALAKEYEAWRTSALDTLAAALSGDKADRTDALFEDAIFAARITPEPRSRVQKLRALAMTLAKAGDHRAVTVFNEAVAAAQTLHDAKWRASALRDLATLLLQSGRYDQAAVVAGTIEDNLIQVYALSDLAVALAQAGDSRADLVFDQAEAVGRAIQQRQSGATVRATQNDFRRSHTPVDMTLVFDKGLIVKEYSDGQVFWEADELRAMALSYLAKALIQAGRYDQTEVVARSIQLDRSDVSESRTLHDLTTALAEAGHFERAERVAQSIKLPQVQVKALCAIALALARSNHSEAERLLNAAVSAIQAIPSSFRTNIRGIANETQAEAQAHLASTLIRMGQLDQAVKLIWEIKFAWPQAEPLREMGVVLYQWGDHRAGAFFDLARQAAQSNPTLLGKLAVALAQVGNDQANAVFDEAWAAARAMKDDWDRLDGLCYLGELLFQVGDGRAEAIFAEVEQAAQTVTGQFRVMAQQRVAAALAQAGRYPQAEAVARAIQDYEAITETRGSIAASLAQEASFCRALTTLGLRQMDAFIQALTAWAAACDRVEPGLAMTALLEAMRIAGWMRQDWRKTYELLHTSTDGWATTLNAPDAKMYGDRGDRYYQLQRYDQALIAYSRAIELQPDEASYYPERGNTSYALQHYDQALVDYTQAIRLDPTAAWNYNNRGLTYCLMKRYEEALTDFNRVIELDPSQMLTYCQRGDVSYNLERYQEALADYQRAIELDPTFYKAYLKRGDVYIQLDEADKAEADYAQVERLKPDLASPGFAQGYLKQRQDEIALAKYNRAIQQGSTNASDYFERATLHLQAKRYQEAVEDYARAIELDPRHEDAYTFSAFAFVALNNSQAAIANYTRALEVSQKAITYVSRGLLYSGGQRYQEAIADYNRTLQLDPALGQAYLRRGETQLNLGNYEEALADFNQAGQLQPDNVEVHFYCGVANERLNRFQEALTAYTRLIELDPQHKDVYYNRGLIYRKLNRPDEAMVDFMRSVELDPAAADSYACMGMLWLERGRLLQALSYFNQAAELGEHEALTYAALVSSQLKLEQIPDGNVLKFAVNILIKSNTQSHLSREVAKYPVLTDPDLLDQLTEVIEQVPGDDLSKDVSRQRVGWLRQIYEQRYATQPPPSKQPFGWLRRLFGKQE